MISRNELEYIKDIIIDNIEGHRGQIYFGLTINSDMRVLYDYNGVTVQVDDVGGYFEVYGLNEKERREIRFFYYTHR